MKVFTPSAMTRPLFEEPSPGCERADPWSGPKGFMIGGMSRSTLQNLGQQYFVAANLLVEAIKRDELEDYKLVNPVLYLYRHWLEVTLKSLISSASDEHDLRRLAEQFGAIAPQQFGQKVPPWIITRLKEIAAVDPNSTAFRYGENYDKLLKCRVPVDGEIYVSLNHLQAAMKALNVALLSCTYHGKFPDEKNESEIFPWADVDLASNVDLGSFFQDSLLIDE